MELRPLREGDLPALIALQAAAPDHRLRSVDHLRRELAEPARGGGEQVVVAVDPDGAVAGALAWVALGDGECYGSPLLARDVAVARVLAMRLVEEADRRGAAPRVTAWPEEPHKAEALAGAGFRQLFEFVFLARDIAPGEVPPLPDGRTALATDAIEPRAFAALSDAAFAGTPNSPAMGDDEGIARAALDPAVILPSACEIVLAPDGRPEAYVIVHRDGELSAIGVLPGARRRGLARILMTRALARSAAAGLPRIRSLIASTNTASLALHAAFDFAEVERAGVWRRSP